MLVGLAFNTDLLGMQVPEKTTHKKRNDQNHTAGDHADDREGVHPLLALNLLAVDWLEIGDVHRRWSLLVRRELHIDLCALDLHLGARHLGGLGWSSLRQETLEVSQ